MESAEVRLALARGNAFRAVTAAGDAGPEFFPAAELPHRPLPGGVPMKLAATWVVEKHAWFAAVVALGAHQLTGAVPPLCALRLRVGADHGYVDGVALPDPGVAWRPATPEELATRLAVHLAPTVAAMGAHRPVRPLWRCASDRVGQAASWCAAALGPEAIALATAVLEADTPLRAPARFAPDGTRRRTGCCLTYRLDGFDRCADCATSPPA